MRKKSQFNRKLNVEMLESRWLCASDWQNASLPLDVNHSGAVEPIDALVVINEINANGQRALPTKADNYSGPLYDTNGDGSVSVLDVLLVVNSFNSVSVGSVAPNIRLPNQDGEMVDLSDLKGNSAVVVYFYPKDETPGCTVEAIDFSARKARIEELGAKVYGVSVDSVTSKKAFSDNHKLTFDVLSDADDRVTTAYGALTETASGTPIAKRTTFIIGADGVVKKVFTDVDVSVHGAQVVAALEAGILNS